MAVVVATMLRTELNGTQLTGFTESSELALDADQIDATTMASGGWKEARGGLRGGTLAINLQQDFAAGATDATLWPLFGSVVTFRLRPTTGAISATNPEYQGNVLINSLKPITAQVGGKMMQQLQWPITGPVTRATA